MIKRSSFAVAECDDNGVNFGKKAHVLKFQLDMMEASVNDEIEIR
jgi:hypothetical protein